MIPISELHPEYITDADGQRISVVLPIAEYEALMEDLTDLGIVAERREEPTISHESIREELKRDGYLAD